MLIRHYRVLHAYNHAGDTAFAVVMWAIGVGVVAVLILDHI